MARKTPVVFSHQEVSVLTKLHALHGDTPEGLHKTEKSFERHTPAAVRAKMIELEMIEKPVKLALTDDEEAAIREDITDAVTSEVVPVEKRTLAVRYAISELQALLPKRAPKAAESK
jgi:hypothetical protein